MNTTRILAALTAVLGVPSTTLAYEISFPYYDSTLEIHANILGSSPSGVRWNTALSDAAGRWTGSGDVRVNVVTQSSDPCAGVAEGTVNDPRNGVDFKDDVCGFAFDEDTLALTLSLIQIYAEVEIVESDILFNRAHSWDVYSGPLRAGRPDFRRVAAHELGHALGLDHEDDVPALMNSAQGDIDAPNADDFNGISALYGDLAAGDGNIELRIEEPVQATPASGVSNVRGWVVGDANILYVELYIDGDYIADVPAGGTRNDVRNAYPARPSSGEAGYSMAFAWSLLEPGEHQIRVRAVDFLGRSAEASGSFTVERFDNPFIADPAKVSVDGSVQKIDPRTIRLNGVRADGKSFDVLLQWQTASQKFEMVDIVPTPN